MAGNLWSIHLHRFDGKIETFSYVLYGPPPKRLTHNSQTYFLAGMSTADQVLEYLDEHAPEMNFI